MCVGVLAVGDMLEKFAQGTKCALSTTGDKGSIFDWNKRTGFLYAKWKTIMYNMCRILEKVCMNLTKTAFKFLKFLLA